MGIFALLFLLLCQAEYGVEGQNEYACLNSTSCTPIGKLIIVEGPDGEVCCRGVHEGIVQYARIGFCIPCLKEFPPVHCEAYGSGICSSIGLYDSSTVVVNASVDAEAQRIEDDIGSSNSRCALMLKQSLCLTSAAMCTPLRNNFFRLCDNDTCFSYYDDMVAQCEGIDISVYLNNSSTREAFCPGHNLGLCRNAPPVPPPDPPSPSPSPSVTPVATPSTGLPQETLMFIIVGVCLVVIFMMLLLFIITCVCCIVSRRKQRTQEISGERVVCVLSPEDPNGSIHSMQLQRVHPLTNGYEDHKLHNGDSKSQHNPLQQQVSPAGSSITSGELRSPNGKVSRQSGRPGSRQQQFIPPHSPHQASGNLQRNTSIQSDQVAYPLFSPTNSHQQQQQVWTSTYPRNPGDGGMDRSQQQQQQQNALRQQQNALRQQGLGKFDRSDSVHSLQGILAPEVYTQPVGQTPLSLSMVDPDMDMVTVMQQRQPDDASPYTLPGSSPPGHDPFSRTTPTTPDNRPSLQKTPSATSASNPMYAPKGPTGVRRVSSSNSGGAPNSAERGPYFHLIPEGSFDEESETEDMPLMRLTEEDKLVLMDSLKEVEIDYLQLELQDAIGEGAFGKVHKGVLLIPAYHPEQGFTKTLVAIKTIKSYSTKEELKAFLRESALMKHFNHPNVLGLIGICLNTPELVPYIVLPYMANGDLRSFLRTKRGGRTSVSQMPNGLSVNQLLLICHQIACGMAYLAESKFVHRDLAARNCMIDDDLNVKVADFGLTRDIYMVDYYKQARLGRVPVKWMAPESLFDRVYNKETDVWSFGVTCWEVFSLGRTPYAGMANHEIGPFLEQGGRLNKPPLCPDYMYSIISWCWEGNPVQRPSFRNLADDLRNLVPENYTNDVYV